MTAEVCPYCRARIALDEPVTHCEGCGTQHHTDCFQENGGCTIFGCSEAPAEEPKLTVSAPDLASAGSTTSMTASAIQTVAPPPPPGAVPPPPAVTEEQSLNELRRISSDVVPSMFSIFGAEAALGDSYRVAEPEPIPAGEPKSRTTFIILGALLGAIGAHNFYAGYHKKAIWQLIITAVTFGLGSPMSWIWAIIDICTVTQDKRGIQFAS